MAYVQGTPTKIATVVNERRHYRVRFSETDVQIASGWVVEELPVGPVTIVGFKSHLSTAGSAASIRSELGVASGWSSEASRDHISKASAAAVWISDYTQLRTYLPEGKLYGRSTPNANGAGVVDVEIELVEGWL